MIHFEIGSASLLFILMDDSSFFGKLLASSFESSIFTFCPFIFIGLRIFSFMINIVVLCL